MQKKWFTLEEANDLLPLIDQELHALQNLKKDFNQKYHSLQTHKYAADEDTGFRLECELEFLEMQAQLHIQNIHSKGAEVKDIETGLVDFPAIWNSEEVLFCWKQGEDEISHYHSCTDGFKGRRKME